jgi:hypothetical protein
VCAVPPDGSGRFLPIHTIVNEKETQLKKWGDCLLFEWANEIKCEVKIKFKQIVL